MDYYVRPQQLYSHSRTCTHRELCRRPSSLVTFHICYLFDCASVHDNSHDLILVYVRYLQPLWRSWSIVYIHLSWRSWSFVYIHHGDSDLLYILHGDDHTCHILYHAYLWPLYYYVFRTAVGICSHMERSIVVLYCWMAGSSTWFFITPLLGWTYNVFRPLYHPFDLTH